MKDTLNFQELEPRKKLMIFAIIGVLILAIVAVFLNVTGSDGGQGNGSVSDSTGMAKPAQAPNINLIGLSAFDGFLNNENLTALRICFDNYYAAQRRQPNGSVNISSVKRAPIDYNNPDLKMSFTMNDGTDTRNVQLVGRGLYEIQLVFYDTAGKQVFDSGSIDPTKPKSTTPVYVES